ncbi:glycoside hydrolase family 127 protein [Solirubrobacter sp. CPCC 204708]|uniref:Glycoside hydrolase family 127 protein n=1 Tax=Solirubrobacter deserti TaxID=2282478 RepID=A0ABT4RDF4_9ACTN|nr:beta-L-arabinofuranosidase domain-containing protein [Solirubrobacter deserti]MBE2314558.1 glycoside hydrolase family 127 protein [Solirubrobacter deserti]MDA0136562.1 glycoside hydrolase family 127 protein [Solirubrobacter deserti]
MTVEATIDGGLWAERRRFNREVLIPDGEQRIREAGTFDNLRAAAAGGGEHRGLVYQDSDLHKWVEALGWELRTAPSPALQRMADEVTALLTAAQASDGYLDTAFQVTGHERYRNLADEHEIYCMGHLIEAGLAHAPLLGVARRAADHLVATFTDRWGVCGHPEAELALVKLYRATGERAYLELAARFVDRRGHRRLPERFGSSTYLVDRVPVREQTEVEGHAVRQLYLNCGATDVFVETGEPLDPLLAAWTDMVERKLYITGGVGSDGAHEAFGAPFALDPATAYVETCAAIASVFWSWRLLQATGEARFADLIERTLLNAVLAGVAPDRSDYAYANTLHGTPDRRPWYACACCPPNLMRLLASLHTYLATEDDGVLTLHQYATGTVGGVRVRTDYPWEGRIEIEADRPVRLRVPGWSARSRLDGAPVAPGYVVAGPGAHTLELDLRLRVVEPDPRVSSIRECVAFERGPLVLCLQDEALVPYAFAERALRVWIPQKVSRQSVWAASSPSTASAPT